MLSSTIPMGVGGDTDDADDAGDEELERCCEGVCRVVGGGMYDWAGFDGMGGMGFGGNIPYAQNPHPSHKLSNGMVVGGD
jgi:hypothetical protein